MMNDLSNWLKTLKITQKKREYKHFDEQLDLDNPSHFDKLQRTLQNLKHHEFLPFIKYIKRDIRYRKNEDKVAMKSVKARSLMYASHLDAHIYSFYSYLWSQQYEVFLQENDIGSCVIAYRRILKEGPRQDAAKSNIELAQETFLEIKNLDDCAVIVADITGFFDSINHRLLKQQLCMVLKSANLAEDDYKVFRSLTAYRYVFSSEKMAKTKEISAYSRLTSKLKSNSEKHLSTAHAVYKYGRDLIKNNRTGVGIPQGSPVSGLLANIYLADFDTYINRQASTSTYKRYSDDIILICPPDKVEGVFNHMELQLKRMDLEINKSKVSITRFRRNEEGLTICIDKTDGNGKHQARKTLDYLGFEFDGQDVVLRGSTVRRAYIRAAKRIEKFYARQRSDYHHKKPRMAQSRQISRSNYIVRAENSMKKIGFKIFNQHDSIRKRLQVKRKNERKYISEYEQKNKT